MGSAVERMEEFWHWMTLCKICLVSSVRAEGMTSTRNREIGWTRPLVVLQVVYCSFLFDMFSDCAIQLHVVKLNGNL